MAISNSEFDFIRELVRRRSAIVLEAGKEYLVESRLEPLARREGIASVTDLVARLRNQSFGNLHADVIEAMTTNETFFFRDQYPFDALRNTVLPQLLVKRRAEKRITIWSAASSTGQEPYSVAMTVKEVVPEGWSVQIVASDISRTVLARAKQGRYSQLEVARGLPANYLARYFRQVGADWVVNEDLRRMIDYREINLAEGWPTLPQLDIILLRNVMIYFDTETKKGILARAGRLLRPDGFLFLGGAETTNYLDDSFERLQVDKAICYRLRGR